MGTEKVASIFLEEVLPEINRIDHRVRNWRSGPNRGLRIKSCLGLGLRWWGFMGTISPTQGQCWLHWE